jgi:hypothetical protein
MSLAPSSAATQQEANSTRLRNFTVSALFLFVSLAGKLSCFLSIPSSWTAFRILLGFAGAALVVVPLGLWNSWVVAIFGMAMFLTAVLLPPVKPLTALEKKARDLGAHVVIRGAKYELRDAPTAAVRIFVGPERVCVTDSRLHMLFVIPAEEIHSACAAESDHGWDLQLRWSNSSAEFAFAGIFADRLARHAERAIADVMRPPVEAPPRARAARA